MMRSKSFLMLLAAGLLLCLAGLSAAAQNLRVQGSVTDTQGEPLVGAMVYVQGTSNGAMTGTDGRYSLSGVPSIHM